MLHPIIHEVVRFRRVIIYIVGFQLLFAVLGFVYQTISFSTDLRQFPAPGKLIDVGGYRLHLYCTGNASEGPTVILESGLGASSLIWSMVQPGVAEHTRVCSYDRAGYGWSDPGPAPRTADHIVDELHLLLERSGEQSPFILAGHSFGGTLNRLFVFKYPADAAGIILVDARHENFFEVMPPEYLKSDETNLNRARWLRVLTPLGITRLAGTLEQLAAFESFLSPLPPHANAAAWAMQVYNPQHWNVSVAEREMIEESYNQVRQARLPDTLPLIVITAENGVEAWRASDDPASLAAEAMWMEMQEQLSHLTANSQWVIVKNSGHYIYFDQPQAIVDAVVVILNGSN
jgi:pimeloyl-ACP methyl ester carboxylesterase